MTEQEKYDYLEDNLIRLNCELQNIVFWRQWFGRPTVKLKLCVENLHAAISIVSQHIEHAVVQEQEKLKKMLMKAEVEFYKTLRSYHSLNRWNYLLDI